MAQNTAGVFPPMVTDDSAAAEYRLGYRPGENGGSDRLAQRLHYQRAVDGDIMWRVVGQLYENGQGDAAFDFVQGEVFWDLSQDTDRWRTGLRFDGVLRDDGRPSQVNINWTNQLALTEHLTGRLILLTKRQFGENRAAGILLETRANVYTELGGAAFGIESYNLHGSTADLDLFGGRQQVGPFAVIPVGRSGWSIFSGVLLGANERSPNTDFRFWLTRNF